MSEVRLKLYRGYWCAVWSEDGKTRRRSLRTQDRVAAEQALADFKSQLAKQGDTVGEIFHAYVKDRAHVSRDAERAGYAWKALAGTFGSLRPDQITRELCRDYVRDRRKAGRGDGTIIRELGTLRSAMLWKDKRSPAQFELPSQPPPRDRHLSKDEARALVAACDRAPHVRLFTVLALTTAARREALLDLTWPRVDFERGIIKLATGEGRRKGRATVPLHDLARPHLLEARRAATTDFVIEYAGRRVRSIRTGFDHACQRANLRDVTPHCLRRTAAVWMAENGVSMSEIAEFLGHEDDRITSKHYARFSPEHLRRAAAAIGW